MTSGVPFSLVTFSSGKQEKVTRHQAEPMLEITINRKLKLIKNPYRMGFLKIKR